MPTERFFRLPEEKVEAIRKAAIKEFMRVPPEGVSINRIIRDADISRGSFYTYFDDKYEMLRWLFSDRVKVYWKFYEASLEENGGDIWDTFEKALRRNIQDVFGDGFMKILQNLLESSALSDMFREGLDAEECENGNLDTKQQFIKRLYELTDREKCPLDETGFADLVEMHGIILLMALKLAIRDKKPMEEIEEFFNRRMKLLRYGAAGQNMEKEIQERQEGKIA